MEYEDRLRLQTPEGVTLELTLAGYGSRFVAALLDALLEVLLIVGVALALGLGAGDAPGALAAAILVLAIFVILVGYHVLFEVLAAGRTPGKRATGLRVVVEGGRPVTFVPSAVRNVLRVVDGPATGYVAGTIAILASRRHQRLGDMAAGTLVIRDRTGASAAARARLPGGEPSPSAAGWDVTGVSAEELAAVRSFLARRAELEAGARQRLAVQLADGLRAKLADAGAGLPPERFLEDLAAAKARRG